MRKSPPTFKEEINLWKQGYSIVIGVDEAGRGAFAGPVMAAAVVLAAPLDILRPQADLDKKTEEFTKLSSLAKLGIRDSKQLSSKKREELEKVIKKRAILYQTYKVDVSVINRIGIGKATQKAMRMAVKNILAQSNRIIEKIFIQNKKNSKNQREGKQRVFVLADGFHIKYLTGIGLKNQKAIVGGDSKCISIAAASILAKVHRDRIMRRLARHYPQYGWEQNKGYGTAKHRAAIARFGITKCHRKAFIKS